MSLERISHQLILSLSNFLQLQAVIAAGLVPSVMSHLVDGSYSFDNNESNSTSSRQGRVNQYQPYRDQETSARQMQQLPQPLYAPQIHANINPPPPPPPSHRGFSSFQSRSPEVYGAPAPATYSTSLDQVDPFATPRHENPRPHDLGYSTSMRTASTITPGMDNLGGTAAGGGIAGIALGVAHTNARDSRVEAPESTNGHSHSGHGNPLERDYNTLGTDTPYVPEPPYGSRTPHPNDSYSSAIALGAAPASFGHLTPQPYEGSAMHLGNYPSDTHLSVPRTYTDSPYKRYSSAWDPQLGQGDIHPDDIEDDEDDGMTTQSETRRRSIPGLNKQFDSTSPKGAALGPTAAGSGILGGLGAMVGRKPVGSGYTQSGNYGPVVGQPGSDSTGNGVEKSEWLTSQTSGRKRLRWIVGTIVALVVIAIIAGAVVGGIKGAQSKNNSSGSSGPAGQTAAQDDGNGDLDKNSKEIQALLNNPDLRRVFPGMAYTPFNGQYPGCLTYPPSQNNVTRDMAVLSQLTNTIRLYGTDCNQTEMVLHAIDKLGLTNMKVWMAVWLDKNSTTNDRGIAAMNDILKKQGDKPFSGVILGNEVLYRKDLTAVELDKVVSDVKKNLTDLSINLPIAIADLGDDWTAALTRNVDVVMSNIHPFFAGVTAEAAAGWAWSFWDTHDVVLTAGTNKKNIISEIGWPSEGGNDCGAATCTSSTQGSIAGIAQMNTFMDNFVCQSLTNGTNYFW